MKKKCPVCASDEITHFLRRKDRIGVYLCGNCTLKFVAQSEFAGLHGEPGKLYQREYFEGGGEFGFDAYEETPMTNFYWQKSFVQLVEDMKGKRILDIGCGTGKFMELLLHAGAEADGVEVSGYAAGVASSKGLRIVAADIAALADEQLYDIITAFDVIEHIPDLMTFLGKVFRLLKEDGVFIFLTPDAGSEKAMAGKENWYGYQSSLEHLYYFTPESLSFLFEKTSGARPVVYRAAAPDGEGLMGFVRKKRSPKDEELEKMFESNFSPGFVRAENVVPVCILLQRLDDRRFLEYAAVHRKSISSHAGEEEADFLLSFFKDGNAGGPTPQAVRQEGTGKVTVRPYREGDEQGIITLFREVFGREMTIEEWRWKYTGQGNRVCAVVLEDTGSGLIAGHYGGIPLRMLHDGKIIRGIAVGDTMIHPRYRSFVRFKKAQSLFMREMVADAAVFFYGFAPNEVIRLAVEKLRLYERVATVYEASKEVGFHKGPSRLIYKLFPLDPRDRRVDGLWDSVKHEFQLCAVRDSAFLTWRYAESRLFSYEVWGLRRRWSQKLLALAVVRKDHSDTLLIMDMVFSRDILEPFLLKIENLASAMGRRKIALWLPQSYHNLLRGKGFAVTDTGATIGTFTHPLVLKKEEISEKFFYTMGDTDYI
jgi:SAM-dependent methyltransferase